MVTAPASVHAAVHVSSHPLLLHHLTRLRSTATPPAEFRVLVRALTQIVFLEAIRELKLEQTTVETPLAAGTGHRIAERIGLMPILRAGLGMTEPILELVPSACVWHLGLYRDHDTLKPVTYYNKLPANLPLDL